MEVPACFRCAPKKCLLSGYNIKRGMHLVFGKYCPYSGLNQYMKEKFSKHILFLYYHHAIVIEIYSNNNEYADVGMIEFGGIPLKATQSRVKIDLTIEYVEYIDYKFQRYTVDEIVRRARYCLRNVFDQDYSVVYNNCEHLARWCVSGEHMSMQVDEKVEMSIDHLQNVVNRLLSYIASAPNSDRIIIDVASTAVILILSNECGYSLLRQSQFERDLKNGFICTRCQTFNKARVVNKGLLAAGAYLFLKTFSKCKTVSLIMKRSDLLWFTVSTIGLGLTYIKSEQKPFGDRYFSQIRITRKNQLPIGSILAHPDFSQVIVKNVNYKSESSTYSQMQIVHYPYRGIWGRRVVSEETFSFNLADDWLQVLEFPKGTVNKRKDVVHEAKLKLGETKFNMFTNRSSHMAWSCKVCYMRSTSKDKK